MCILNHKKVYEKVYIENHYILFTLLIIMLYNSFIEYKKILNTFTLEEQLRQIDATINLLATRKYKGTIKDNRYERIR